MTRGGGRSHRCRGRRRRLLCGHHRRADERQADERGDVTAVRPHGCLPAATDVTGSEKCTRPVASS